MNSKVSRNFAIEADNLLSLGKTGRAISLCKKGLASYPDYHTAYSILARAYILRKNFQKAEFTARAGLAQFPSSRALLNVRDVLDRRPEPIETHWLSQNNRKLLYKLSVLILVIFLPIIIILTVLPPFMPDWSSIIAENMRGLFGTGIVTRIEEFSFGLQDNLNKALYKLGDRQELNLDIKAGSHPKNRQKDSLSENLVKTGWNVLHTFNGENIIYSKKIYPDPDRPFAQVFMILMRLDKIEVNLSVNGRIPIEKQDGNLLAAFNGGFRLVHGRYGIMLDRKIHSKPVNSIGTLFIYDDGRIDIDKWLLKDSIPSNLLSFRQNCPLIIEKGEISKSIQVKNPAIWGFTVDNALATWRSGVGITKDRKFLVYGLGKSLTVNTLALGFRECGVYNAIQLDINRAWTKFVIYPQTEEPRTAKRIIRDLCVSKYEYLTRTDSIHRRDFFYLCYKH